ncbi:putative arabinose efflux permease, MFS family [Fodinibius salinus]|uniref:Putative arabinose efflux permease, MFS family n=1 Tax=Fodinibius salinus TaxID=860790 RepID=A0A5D3YJW0_9BACT|nr:MFS transporter [Fodinibius salinus]TYP93798.1 putative arabinose efflux permease, MFS family [Fodinibius salinus]
MSNSIPKRILPVIVLAQFAGTSLWFAGNAVIPDLVQELQLTDMAIGYITSAVQVGFIAGTLLFAFLSVADRISPSKVFLGCAITGAACNVATVYSDTFLLLMVSRFGTGFFLAGIYPVGMKIASDWHKEGLGKALGYLVGALVLGTAFPHLIKYFSADLPWKIILFATSAFSGFGGILLYVAVPDGPHQGKKGEFRPTVIFQLFKNPNFRSAAFGYFGHMWELYTFWAFVPIMVGFYKEINTEFFGSIPLWSFVIIGIGGISCAIGGYWAIRSSSKKVALASLIGSGFCCLLVPVMFELPFYLFMGFLLGWGLFVVSDSPQFSTLVAQSADRDYVATGLTIVNSIGFAITIVSIQLVNLMWISWQSPFVFLVMAIGPLLGAISIMQYGVSGKRDETKAVT